MTTGNLKNISTCNKICFILVFTVVLFVIEKLYSAIIQDYSGKLVKKMLKKGSTDHCDAITNLQFFEYSGKFLLLFMIYNITNTFSAVSLVLLDAFSIFMNGILKIIYTSPRPFWVDVDLQPCFCAVNFGNPSTTGLNQVVVFYVTYKAFTTRYKNTNKIIMGILCALPIFTIYFSRLLQGVHSINQLFFGAGIGITICYVYFEILGVELDNIKHFEFFTKNLVKFIMISLSLYIIFIIYQTNTVFANHNDWISVIQNYCEIKPYDLFENESYKKSSRLFLFVSSCLGLMLEQKYSFNNNLQKFLLYNSNQKFIFNNTQNVSTITRIILMFAVYLILAKCIVDNIGDSAVDSFVYLTVFVYIIPYMIYGILFFFILKLVMKLLGLTNETILDLMETKSNYDDTESNSIIDNINPSSEIHLQLNSNLKENLLDDKK